MILILLLFQLETTVLHMYVHAATVFPILESIQQVESTTGMIMRSVDPGGSGFTLVFTASILVISGIHPCAMSQG